MRNFFTKYWNPAETEQKLWFLVWFSLPVNLRLTSYTLIFLTLFVVINLQRNAVNPFRKPWKAAIPFFLLFIWQARELLEHHPFLPAWKEVEKNFSLIIIPVLYLFTGLSQRKMLETASLGMTFSILLCSSIIVPAALVRFLHSFNPHEFIYHDLASPLHTGAIFFSLYILFALFLLKEAEWLPENQGLREVLALYLIFLVLLLASKILIITGIPLLAFYYRNSILNLWKSNRIKLGVVIILISAGCFPVILRMKPVVNSFFGKRFTMDINKLTGNDGVQLRLILWKNGIKIIRENHSCLTGTGMINTRNKLNAKLFSKHPGINPVPVNTNNYRNYNFHNQYVETLVRQGIAGLFLLILILVIPFFHHRRKFNILYFNIIAIFLCFSESVLERQAGIVFLCLFLCLHLLSDERNSEILDQNS